MEFTFYNPTKVIFGKGKISELGKEMAFVKKALLVAGSGSIKKNGVYEQVAKSLEANGVEWVEVWGVKPNPTLAKVREMIEVAKKEKVDAILAVGGGSVIDASKTVAAGVFLEDVWNAFEGKAIVKKALPLFVVLTLSATGSEMNRGAVITNEEEKKKWSFVGEALFPRVSIIDSSVQATLPKNQTAYGAIDGLSHVMENYFVGKKEETTLAVDEALMKTMISECDKLMANQNDEDARANLAWALTLALNGISGVGLKGGDWASHGIEHAISAFHTRIAHGEGLAIVFPAWITYVHKNNPETFKRWAENVWNAGTVEEAVKKMKAKYAWWGVATSLRRVGISEAEIPALAENAFQSGRVGQVKQLGKKDIEEILKLAL